MSSLNDKIIRNRVRNILGKTNSLKSKYEDITTSQAEKKIKIHPSNEVKIVTEEDCKDCR